MYMYIYLKQMLISQQITMSEDGKVHIFAISRPRHLTSGVGEAEGRK